MSTDPSTVARNGGRRLPLVGWLVVGGVAFLLGLLAMHWAQPIVERWFEPKQEMAAPAGYSPPETESAAGNRGPAPNVDALTARENALAAQIAQLEAQIAQAGIAAGNASSNANRSEALLVAFSARRQLDRGQPLGYVEEQLKARFPKQPRAVATVITDARVPVTLDSLRIGLDVQAQQLVAGTMTDGWWKSLRRQFSNLVVIRRADQAPNVPADQLAQARRLLDGGNVEGAIATVVRMPGAGSASRWVMDANRYVEAHRALDVIETAAILGQAAPSEASGQPATPPGPALAPSNAPAAAAPAPVTSTTATANNL